MTIPSTFRFKGKASAPRNAIALIYDLEGFSRFFNLPEVQDYIPDFLNHISETFAVALFGGSAKFFQKEEATLGPLRVQVAHEKFMGDGGLYVLLPRAGAVDFPASDLSVLCNRLWNLKNRFPQLMHAAMHKVPVADLPKKIRFGLSRGAVYELHRTDSHNSEYIGFCINLASRLQNYCSDLGFIASARLNIPADELAQNGYKKVIATKLKGFSNEVVIVDTSEYGKIPAGVKAEIFREIGAA